ncbi:MAG: ABC transporter permease [Nitrospinota bacterium]
MKLIFLWTDSLLFLFFATIIAFSIYSARFEHLRAPWRQFRHNKVAVLSALVLLGYMVIALVDSIHFQERSIDANGTLSVDSKGKPVYNPEVTSLLDHLLKPIREKEESTYSAPFSTHSYSKKNIELENGKTIRDFPRLKYGGAHLQKPERRTFDASLRGAAGGFPALFLTGLLLFFLSKTHFSLSPKILVFVLLFSFLFGAILSLSAYYHVFGTDKVGQDVLYRALKGIRTGILIGTLTTLVMLPLAILFGIMAGYFRGWIDDTIQYVYTTLSSIPGILLISAAILLLQVYMDTHPDQFESLAVRADLRLFFLCIILGVSSWTGLCRILRGETLKLSSMDYILASKALGTKSFKTLFTHIVPNILHIVLITVVLDFSGLVLAEAVLSYVGVGVDPTMESWGNMINAARLELAREPIVWWNLAAAFTLMFGLVLSANLFADGVRDAFDPRLRTR